MHCDRRHLHAIVVLAYVLILLSVAHVITQSVSTPVELATPPLCLHSPFAGISHAVVLGAPRHTNKFFACTLNASVRVVLPPELNLTDSGLSLANLYHLTTPKHAIFRDIEVHTLAQAAEFFAFLAALRTVAPGTRALILENSAVVAPDPRWTKLHAIASRTHFDLLRLEPCGGVPTVVEPPLTLQRCVGRCFSPWSPASAIVSYIGAQKLLHHATRDHQAYDIGWFQGLVQMADPTFEMFCVDGLHVHEDEEGWKIEKRGMLR